MSIQPQCTIEEAVALLLAAVKPMERQESVPLQAAAGRVLGENLLAQVDVPPFDRSAMDGYAVRRADLPGRLRVTQRIYAGQMPEKPVFPGEAARIMTGAPIPAGADCVIRQEIVDRQGDIVEIGTDEVCKTNIAKRASDTKTGALLLKRGTILDWTHLPLLASQGYAAVPVYQKPRIAVLSTGDELVEPGTLPLPEGKIYNSNTALILGRLRSLGVEAENCGIGADDAKQLAAQIQHISTQFDLIITAGGVSVGEKDCMASVLDELQGKLILHGVAAKPGTPTMAFLAQIPVLCLSGNPFAASAMLEVLGRPMVERLRGADWQPLRTEAVVRGSFPKTAPMRRFVRGRLVGGSVEIGQNGHESGSIAALAGCNCLLDIPPNTELHDGDRVTVLSML